MKNKIEISSAEESTPRTRQMGRDGRLDISIALDIIDENLYPGQTGWGLEMATAIDELHFHKPAIVKCVNAHAALLATLEKCAAQMAINNWSDERELLAACRSVINKAKGEL